MCHGVLGEPLGEPAPVENFVLEVVAFQDVQDVGTIAVHFNLTLGLAQIWAGKPAVSAGRCSLLSLELGHIAVPDFQF